MLKKLSASQQLLGALCDNVTPNGGYFVSKRN